MEELQAAVEELLALVVRDEADGDVRRHVQACPTEAEAVTYLRHQLGDSGFMEDVGEFGGAGIRFQCAGSQRRGVEVFGLAPGGRLPSVDARGPLFVSWAVLARLLRRRLAQGDLFTDSDATGGDAHAFRGL